MSQEMFETKQFFVNNHIQLSDFWLESCIKWFHEEKGNAAYTKKELHTKVYEQWLLLDLRDVDVPLLPLNINNEKKIVLNNSFSLQLMSVVDISRSKFSQLQKIKNLNALTRGFDEEKEVELGSKRMLQLNLTDGIQEIKAIEYKHIPVLNINLTPGMKIKINGPVTIRRGQMMLDQQNVKLLGGEVEEILISNSAENILARYLNLPENPNPNVVDESLILNESIGNMNNRSNNYNSTNIHNPRTQSTKQILVTDHAVTNKHIPVNRIDMNISNDEEMRIAAEVEMLFKAEKDIFEQNSIRETSSKLVTEKDMLQIKENISEDEFQNMQLKEFLRTEDEIEALLEIEKELLNESNNKTKSGQTPDMFDEINKASKSNKQDEHNESDINSSLEMQDEIFQSLELDEHLEQIEKTYHVKQKYTIKEILGNIQNRKYGKYKVWAKFKSVIQKMTVKDDKWIVQIYVTDSENEELAVYVHSDVVSYMSGFTAQEAMRLKQHIENKNSNALQTIMKALEQLKNKLVKLDCLMEVECIDDIESPTITKLL